MKIQRHVRAYLIAASLMAPCAGADTPSGPQRQAYFGDLHLHTSYSFDAYILFGAKVTPVWSDPEFNPATPAVYYLRVLEIPTARWSTILAVKRGQALPQGVPTSVQERGWSSPIWYTANSKSWRQSHDGSSTATPRVVLLRARVQAAAVNTSALAAITGVAPIRKP